jgi:naphthalene 1,2-dioxygenase system ferredoxin subunit
MDLEYHAVASRADVAVDSALHVRAGGREIALCNLGGTFYALGGICTHGAARLARGTIEGDLIECPLHAGTFEIKTGRAVDQPCTVNTKSYPVRIDGETVLVGIEPPA